MEQLLAAIPGVVSGIMIAVLGWLAGRLGEARRNRKAEQAQLAEVIERLDAIEKAEEADKAKREALYKGMKAELRESLVNAYEKYVVDKKPLTVERFHEITEGFEAYSILGGNGTGKTMYEGICEVALFIAK